jgi:hypothetical protein
MSCTEESVQRSMCRHGRKSMEPPMDLFLWAISLNSKDEVANKVVFRASPYVMDSDCPGASPQTGLMKALRLVLDRGPGTPLCLGRAAFRMLPPPRYQSCMMRPAPEPKSDHRLLALSRAIHPLVGFGACPASDESRSPLHRMSLVEPVAPARTPAHRLLARSAAAILIACAEQDHWLSRKRRNRSKSDGVRFC